MKHYSLPECLITKTVLEEQVGSIRKCNGYASEMTVMNGVKLKARYIEDVQKYNQVHSFRRT